jgi:hypothetical protein
LSRCRHREDNRHRSSDRRCERPARHAKLQWLPLCAIQLDPSCSDCPRTSVSAMISKAAVATALPKTSCAQLPSRRASPPRHAK